MSKGSRVLQGSALTSLALILFAPSAPAQTAPAPGKTPAAQPRAAAPARGPSVGPTNAPAGTPAAIPGSAAPAPAPVPDTGAKNEWSTPDDDDNAVKTPEELDIERRFALLRAGQGITPDDVAQRTVKNNANVESKRRAIETANYGVDAAKAGYWPQLKVSASYTRLSPVPKLYFFSPALANSLMLPPAEAKQLTTPITIPVNAYSLDAGLSVPISDFVFKVSHSVASASHQTDAATFDGYAAAASVARDARVNYYQWIRAKAQELVVAQALIQAKGQQRDAENGFEAGLNSKADVLRTQAGVTAAELAVEQAKNATELARLALQVGMGDPSGQNYEVGEDVLKEAPELDRLPTIEAAYQEAVDHRAEIKSLVAAQKSAREQATATRIAEYPRLDAQGAASYANPNQRYFLPDGKFHSSWSAGVVLSWTPTAIPGAAAGANTAESKAGELVAQERSVRDGLRIEVEQAIKSAEISKLSIESNLVTLKSVREAYRVRRELFRAGRATLVDVTNAATDLNTTRIALVDAYVDSRISLVQLNHALGRDVAPYKDSMKPAQR